jgi:hypothetical protein
MPLRQPKCSGARQRRSLRAASPLASVVALLFWSWAPQPTVARLIGRQRSCRSSRRCFRAQTCSAARKASRGPRRFARRRFRPTSAAHSAFAHNAAARTRAHAPIRHLWRGACRGAHLDCDTATPRSTCQNGRSSAAAAPVRHAVYKSNQVFSVHERALRIMRSTGQKFEQNSARRDTMENREALRGQRVGQMSNWQSCTTGFTPSDRMTFASTSGSNDCGCTLGRYA